MDEALVPGTVLIAGWGHWSVVYQNQFEFVGKFCHCRQGHSNHPALALILKQSEHSLESGLEFTVASIKNMLDIAALQDDICSTGQ